MAPIAIRTATAAITTHQIGSTPVDCDAVAAGVVEVDAPGTGVPASVVDDPAGRLGVDGVVRALVGSAVVGAGVVRSAVVGAGLVDSAVVGAGLDGAAFELRPFVRPGVLGPPPAEREIVTDEPLGSREAGNFDAMRPAPLPHAVSASPAQRNTDIALARRHGRSAFSITPRSRPRSVRALNPELRL